MGLRTRPAAVLLGALILAVASGAAAASARAPAPMRSTCLKTLHVAPAGVLCDPDVRRSGRAVLSAHGYRDGRGALRGAFLLPPGRTVRIRGRASRRAQLILGYRLRGGALYVRFARFGSGRDLGTARVVSGLGPGGGLKARLRARGRWFAPVAKYASLAAIDAHPPAPASPPAAVAPAGVQDTARGAQWIGCRDGTFATAVPDAALDHRWAQEVQGWGGGDGALSAPLPDGRVVWLFGDSVLGSPAGRPFVHNALVVQDGETLTHAGAGLSAALESGSPDRWYWPQAATVEQGELRAFFARYERVGSGPWGFRYLDSQLAEISLPDLTVRRVTTVMGGTPVTWGSAILEDGPYTYVYGVEDRGLVKSLHVARAPRGGLLGPWSVWTGLLGWGPGPIASTSIQDGVSNQVSIVATGGGYLLITQEPLLGRRVFAMWARSPTGPWSSPQVIYTTPERPGLLTYNAVAHPELSSDGRLLVSYSVNGTGEGTPTVYAPRFFRVPSACLKGR